MCPSVVVTDLAMPRLDGRALARWFKARYPSVPILLLTGEVLDCTTKSALNRTFEAVLSKPLQVESFLTLLDRLMPPCAPDPPVPVTRLAVIRDLARPL